MAQRFQSVVALSEMGTPVMPGGDTGGRGARCARPSTALVHIGTGNRIYRAISVA